MLAAAGAALWWLLARPATDPPLLALGRRYRAPAPAPPGPLLAVGLAGGAGMLVHALAGHAAGPSSLRP